jgi:hypothetical protein
MCTRHLNGERSFDFILGRCRVDQRETGLDLQDILGPAQRIKSIRSGKEASVDFESSDWNWSDRANGQTDCRRIGGLTDDGESFGSTARLDFCAVFATLGAFFRTATV